MGAREGDARSRQSCPSYIEETDLSPETLKQTLEVALASGFGYPRLDGPDAKGRMRLSTPIPPRWQSLIDDTLRLERKGAAIGALPAIVFDPRFFLDESKGRAVFRPKSDTVLLHLGHPVFHYALSTLARLRFPGSGRKQRDHTAIRQIVDAYGTNESIVSNCHVRIAFAPNQFETAELLSKMTGTATVAKASYNFSGSRLSPVMGHINASVEHIQRPLMTPDDVSDHQETYFSGPARRIVWQSGPV